VELTALVSATRTSAALAAEAASRCAMELATLEALRLKLMDTELCKMCPAGSAPVLQTRCRGTYLESVVTGTYVTRG
jgi:hypothetical protein